MANENDEDLGDPTPADMRRWLENEIRNCKKALELRTKEATAFVAAYEEGKRSWEQTSESHAAYMDRWGEALPGTSVRSGITDEQLVEEIDSARGKQSISIRQRQSGRSR
jgi:hypothetical protein